jgi:SnoaL-like domain
MQSEEVSSADVANMMQGLLDRQAIQDIISCEMDARRREHQGQHERLLQLAALAGPPFGLNCCYSLGQDSHQGEDSAILQQWEEIFSETGTVDYSAAGGTGGSYRDLAGDTAHARTDFFATHRGRADQGWNVHYNASGAFHDDLVRTPIGWRIEFRRLEVYFGDPLEDCQDRLSGGVLISIRGRMVDYSDRTSFAGQCPVSRLHGNLRNLPKTQVDLNGQ